MNLFTATIITGKSCVSENALNLPKSFTLTTCRNEIQSMKLIIFTCLFIMTSCTQLNDSSNNKPASKTLFIDNKELINGTLLIHLAENKPKCLAIQTPDSEWFVLQDNKDSIEIMPQQQFDSAVKFKFNIQTLSGTTWRDAKKTVDIIFRSPGNYLVYFADNLETEPENTFSLQEVIEIKNIE